jgi:ketosteroid isomerase-like protein
MEDHPHFIIANRLWDAIARGDAETLHELICDKSVWRMYGRSPLAGAYLGPDAILEFMARVGELADDLRSDLIDVFVNDRGAVLRYAIHAVRGGKLLDTEHLFLIHVAGGRITEGVFAPVDQYGYDRFFSPQ